jgi:hypothetical protein
VAAASAAAAAAAADATAAGAAAAAAAAVTVSEKYLKKTNPDQNASPSFFRPPFRVSCDEVVILIDLPPRTEGIHFIAFFRCRGRCRQRPPPRPQARPRPLPRPRQIHKNIKGNITPIKTPPNLFSEPPGVSYDGGVHLDRADPPAQKNFLYGVFLLSRPLPRPSLLVGRGFRAQPAHPCPPPEWRTKCNNNLNLSPPGLRRQVTGQGSPPKKPPQLGPAETRSETNCIRHENCLIIVNLAAVVRQTSLVGQYTGPLLCLLVTSLKRVRGFPRLMRKKATGTEPSLPGASEPKLDSKRKPQPYRCVKALDTSSSAKNTAFAPVQSLPNVKLVPIARSLF